MVIHDDVWIGLNVVVLQGVTIGQGSIIGAGSVVTRDVPPFSIARGVPAKVVRSRRDAGEISVIAPTAARAGLEAAR